MRSRILFVAAVAAALAAVLLTPNLTAEGPHTAQVSAFFTPRVDSRQMNCRQAILQRIDNAQSQILVQQFDISDPEFGAHLIGAIRRGVDVQVLLDETLAFHRDSQSQPLLAAGSVVRLDDHFPWQAHDKILIVDSRYTLTGSYHLTWWADRNVENVTIIDSPATANDYIGHFQQHLGHSRPLPPQAAPTARCVDGSYSASPTCQGACAGHGAVWVWYDTSCGP